MPVAVANRQWQFRIDHKGLSIAMVGFCSGHSKTGNRALIVSLYGQAYERRLVFREVSGTASFLLAHHQ
jgi:hypothetical protein